MSCGSPPGDIAGCLVVVLLGTLQDVLWKSLGHCRMSCGSPWDIAGCLVAYNPEWQSSSTQFSKGARCSSFVRVFANGAMGPSDRSFMVDPLNYFSFQPVLHDWCKKRPWYVLSCLWDGAYKRTLACNQKK